MRCVNLQGTEKPYIFILKKGLRKKYIKIYYPI